MNARMQTSRLKNNPLSEADALADVFSPACEGFLSQHGLSA